MPVKLVLVIKECNVLYHITTTTVPFCDNALDDRLNDASGNMNNLSSRDKLPPCFTYLTCSCTFSNVKLREVFELFFKFSPYWNA